MFSYSERIIDLLDRKYKFLMEIENEKIFWLEFINFLEFLMGDEFIKPYTTGLRFKFEDRQEWYKRELQLQVNEAIEIRHKLVTLFPELDNSNVPAPSTEEEASDRYNPYYQSLAHFDESIKDVEQESVRIWEFDVRGKLKSVPQTGILIPILDSRLNYISGHDDFAEVIVETFRDLQRRYNYLANNFLKDYFTQPEFAWPYLLGIKEKLIPTPNKFNPSNYKVNKWHKYRIPWEYINPYKEKREDVELPLRRIYERIRADIGSTLAHKQLIQRYGERCMYYDRQRIIDLCESARRDKKIAHVEDVLTKDLALYLFDNGVSTLYRVRQGVHEYDLLATDSTLAIEVKQYSNNENRGALIQGVFQLYSYANGLKLKNKIYEFYYVVFRLGGPSYDWPERIEINGQIIYPVTIDLAPSNESGRGQSKTIKIGEKDILGLFDKGKTVTKK